MKSTTAKICTILDVNVVAGSCLLGLISGLIGLRQTQEINRRLNEVHTIYVYLIRLNEFSQNHFVIFYLTIILKLHIKFSNWFIYLAD